MQAAAVERSKLIEKAAGCLSHGDLDAALRHYLRLFDDDPRDWSVGNTLGDLYIRMGQAEDAISHFTVLAEQLAADGFAAKARALYRKILRLQPGNDAARVRVDELDRQQVGAASPFLKRVLETARTQREASAPSFAQAQADANSALARGDCRAAAAHLEQFIACDARHLPALEMRIDVCIDGALEAEVIGAQRRLVEACLADGQYRRAFDIALDLCAREPDVAAHRDRVDRIVAAGAANGHRFIVPVTVDYEPESEIAFIAAQPGPAPMEPAPMPAPAPPPASTHMSHAAPVFVTPVAERPAEIPEPVVEPHVAVAAAGPSASIAIGPPFGDLLTAWSDPERQMEDIRQTLLEDAAAASEEGYAEASRLIAARQLREAIAPLEDAMCLPHLRVSAGSRLACVYRDTGEPVDALTVLEWVAEMPPADEESGHELAYELALTLEALGQESQALGVYRELLAEVGPSYRDVATRAERLAAA